MYISLASAGAAQPWHLTAALPLLELSHYTHPLTPTGNGPLTPAPSAPEHTEYTYTH